MSKKFTVNFLFLPMVLFIVSSLFSQDGGGADTPKKLKVKNGVVELGKKKYPVYHGVKEAEEGQFSGIVYRIEEKTENLASSTAAKLRKYYAGRKIGSAVMPAFVKIGKPDTEAWYSKKCGKDGMGVQVVIKIEEKILTVYILNDCDEGVHAMIL